MFHDSEARPARLIRAYRENRPPFAVGFAGTHEDEVC